MSVYHTNQKSLHAFLIAFPRYFCQRPGAVVPSSCIVGYTRLVFSSIRKATIKRRISFEYGFVLKTN